jgi:hypothetical protein
MILIFCAASFVVHRSVHAAEHALIPHIAAGLRYRFLARVRGNFMVEAAYLIPCWEFLFDVYEVSA